MDVHDNGDDWPFFLYHPTYIFNLLAVDAPAHIVCQTKNHLLFSINQYSNIGLRARKMLI